MNIEMHSNSTSGTPRSRQRSRSSSISSSHASVKQDARVQVFVRARPLESSFVNEACEASSPLEFPSEREIKLIDSKQETTYKFDHVFSPTTTNKEVCEVICSPLIDTVLHGYNGSFMVYGQTGTGKTFTVQAEDGLIPTTITQLFNRIDEDNEFDYSVYLSYLQIYHERVYDLLDSTKDVDLHLREHPEEGIMIEGLSECKITTTKDAESLLDYGRRQLIVAETKMVRVSSRSHSLCILRVQKSKRKPEIEKHFSNDEEIVLDAESFRKEESFLKGKLYLCDLAGSERLKKSGVTGDRLKEARYINTSLLELGNVIHALSVARNHHVPFRNSTLTRILKESLGGNSRASLMICISSSMRYISETKCSLNFGQRALRVTKSTSPNVEQTAEKKDGESDSLSHLAHVYSKPRCASGLYPKIDYKALSEYLAKKLKELELAYQNEKAGYKKMQAEMKNSRKGSSKIPILTTRVKTPTPREESILFMEEIDKEEYEALSASEAKKLLTATEVNDDNLNERSIDSEREESRPKSNIKRTLEGVSYDDEVDASMVRRKPVETSTVEYIENSVGGNVSKENETSKIYATMSCQMDENSNYVFPEDGTFSVTENLQCNVKTLKVTPPMKNSCEPLEGLLKEMENNEERFDKERRQKHQEKIERPVPGLQESYQLKVNDEFTIDKAYTEGKQAEQLNQQGFVKGCKRQKSGYKDQEFYDAEDRNMRQSGKSQLEEESEERNEMRTVQTENMRAISFDPSDTLHIADERIEGINNSQQTATGKKEQTGTASDGTRFKKIEEKREKVEGRTLNEMKSSKKELKEDKCVDVLTKDIEKYENRNEKDRTQNEKIKHEETRREKETKVEGVNCSIANCNAEINFCGNKDENVDKRVFAKTSVNEKNVSKNDGIRDEILIRQDDARKIEKKVGCSELEDTCKVVISETKTGLDKKEWLCSPNGGETLDDSGFNSFDPTDENRNEIRRMLGNEKAVKYENDKTMSRELENHQKESTCLSSNISTAKKGKVAQLIQRKGDEVREEDVEGSKDPFDSNESQRAIGLNSFEYDIGPVVKESEHEIRNASYFSQHDASAQIDEIEDMASKEEREIEQGNENANSIKIQPEMKPKIKSERKLEMEPKMKSEVKSEMKPEMEHRMKSEMEQKMEPIIKSDVKSEMEPEMEPRMKAEMEPKMEPRMKSDVKSEMEPEMKPEMEHRMKSEMKSDVKSIMEPEMVPRMKADVKSEMKPEMEPRMKSEMEQKMEPIMKSDVKPAMGPEIKSDVKSEMEPEMEPRMKAEMEPKMEPKIKSDVKSEMEPEMEPRMKSDVKSEMEPEMEPRMKSDMKSEIEPDIESKMRSGVKSEMEPKIKSKAKPEMKPKTKIEMKIEMEPRMKADVKSEMKPEINSKVKPEAITEEESTVLQSGPFQKSHDDYDGDSFDAIADNSISHLKSTKIEMQHEMPTSSGTAESKVISTKGKNAHEAKRSSYDRTSKTGNDAIELKDVVANDEGLPFSTDGEIGTRLEATIERHLDSKDCTTESIYKEEQKKQRICMNIEMNIVSKIGEQCEKLDLDNENAIKYKDAKTAKEFLEGKGPTKPSDKKGETSTLGKARENTMTSKEIESKEEEFEEKKSVTMEKISIENEDFLEEQRYFSDDGIDEKDGCKAEKELETKPGMQKEDWNEGDEDQQMDGKEAGRDENRKNEISGSSEAVSRKTENGSNEDNKMGPNEEYTMLDSFVSENRGDYIREAVIVRNSGEKKKRPISIGEARIISPNHGQGGIRKIEEHRLDVARESQSASRVERSRGNDSPLEGIKDRLGLNLNIKLETDTKNDSARKADRSPVSPTPSSASMESEFGLALKEKDKLQKALCTVKNQYEDLLEEFDKIIANNTAETNDEGVQISKESYQVALKCKEELELEIRKAREQLAMVQEAHEEQTESLLWQSSDYDFSEDGDSLSLDLTDDGTNVPRETSTPVPNDKSIFGRSVGSVLKAKVDYKSNAVQTDDENASEREIKDKKMPIYREMGTNTSPESEADSVFLRDHAICRRGDAFDEQEEDFGFAKMKSSELQRLPATLPRRRGSKRRQKPLQLDEMNPNHERWFSRRSLVSKEQARRNEKLTLQAIENAELKKELLLTKLEKIRLEAMLSCVMMRLSPTEVEEGFRKISVNSITSSTSTLRSTASLTNIVQNDPTSPFQPSSPFRRLNPRRVTSFTDEENKSRQHRVRFDDARKTPSSTISPRSSSLFGHSSLLTQSSLSPSSVDFDLSSYVSSDFGSTPVPMERVSPCGQDGDEKLQSPSSAKSKSGKLAEEAKDPEMIVAYRGRHKMLLTACLPFRKKKKNPKKLGKATEETQDESYGADC